jgi:general secretion pathway protein G
MFKRAYRMLTVKKARRAAKRGQRGMTLLEIMIVLAILALVMGLVVGPRVMKMFGESKVDIAKMTVNKYANEAFPSWAASHSDGCPKGLADLNEYMNNKDIKDPWGQEYKMYCGTALPAGAKGLAVMSNGEDGKEGTSDDIKSW